MIKARQDIDITKECILKECENGNKVIIQNGNILECYFKNEDRALIMDIRNDLLERLSVDLINNIEFK